MEKGVGINATISQDKKNIVRLRGGTFRINVQSNRR